MGILRRSNGYSKVDKEDPEDFIHRRSQFLICKVMEQADCRRKPSFIRIRLCRLKVKIGRRLKKLRKSALVSISAARIGVYKQVTSQLKTWCQFFNRCSHHSAIATLPRPLFT